MFALKSPMLFSCIPMRRKISRVIRGYYKLDKTNCRPIGRVEDTRLFHVLAFIKGGDTGIYSVKEYLREMKRQRNRYCTELLTQ